MRLTITSKIIAPVKETQSTDHRTYMDAARFGRCLRRDGIEVRLQSYIRPTSAELGSAWP
jgi:hypothetical protein